MPGPTHLRLPATILLGLIAVAAYGVGLPGVVEAMCGREWL